MSDDSPRSTLHHWYPEQLADTASDDARRHHADMVRAIEAAAASGGVVFTLPASVDGTVFVVTALGPVPVGDSGEVGGDGL